MFSNSRNVRKTGKRPRRARRGGAIGISQQTVNRQYIEKSIFSNLPREIEFALDYHYHDENTGGSTSQSARIAPLCEFNTQLPRYAAEFYQIYRQARIMAIDVRMDVVNTSSSQPLIAVATCLPLGVCNGITDPKTVIDVPGSVVKQVGLSTGMSKVTIVKRFVTERMLGELTIGSNSYLQTYSEAVSAATYTELPCIYTGVISANGGASWTGIVDYKLRYHIRFSEYNIPALGLNKIQKPLSMESKPFEMEEDDVEWIQPPPIRVKKNDISNSSRLAK